MFVKNNSKRPYTGAFGVIAPGEVMEINDSFKADIEIHKDELVVLSAKEAKEAKENNDPDARIVVAKELPPMTLPTTGKVPSDETSKDQSKDVK